VSTKNDVYIAPTKTRNRPNSDHVPKPTSQAIRNYLASLATSNMGTCRTGEETKTARKSSETTPFKENLSGSLIVGKSPPVVMTCTTNLSDLKKEICNVVTNEYTPYNVKRRGNYLRVHAGPKSYLMIYCRSKSLLITITNPPPPKKNRQDSNAPHTRICIGRIHLYDSTDKWLRCKPK
jgi:hypothetical protein